MLPRQLRFPLRSRISDLKTFKRVEGKYFTAYVNKEEEPSQGAVVVGKDVSLLSTKRNFIKRSALSALHRQLKEFPGKSIILRAKRSTLSVPYEKLTQDITNISTKL